MKHTIVFRNEIIFATAEDIRILLEEKLNEKLGYFVSLQEYDDDINLEIYMHSDNFEELSEESLMQLKSFEITEDDSFEAICKFLEEDNLS